MVFSEIGCSTFDLVQVADFVANAGGLLVAFGSDRLIEPRAELLDPLVTELNRHQTFGNLQVEKVGDRIEQGVEEVLSRLNIPSKRDIEELSSRIAQLTARVEELKKK